MKTLGGDGKFFNHLSLSILLTEVEFIEANIKLSTAKIEAYTAGYGTVLFFEDKAVIEGIAASMPPCVHDYLLL